MLELCTLKTLQQALKVDNIATIADYSTMLRKTNWLLTKEKSCHRGVLNIEKVVNHSI